MFLSWADFRLHVTQTNNGTSIARSRDPYFVRCISSTGDLDKGLLAPSAVENPQRPPGTMTLEAVDAAGTSDVVGSRHVEQMKHGIHGVYL